MRSEWHRYNLKRKVAELPPISSDDYKEKITAAEAVAKATADGATFSKHCDICQKSYFSQNAYQNHISSQKHKVRAATSESGGEISAVPSLKSQTTDSEVADPEANAEFAEMVNGLKDTKISESEPPSRRPTRPHQSRNQDRREHPLSPSNADNEETQPDEHVEVPPLTRCIFCNYESPTAKLSVDHMTKHHGLFIPEEKYLTDQDGLMGYLAAKISLNHECLWCHKLKASAAAVQTHMKDKGHCRIAFETEEEMIEVGQFYDFSSTYSDPEAADSDTEMEEATPTKNGGVKLSPKLSKKDTEDDGWETDSSFSSLDSEEIVSIHGDRTDQFERLPLHRHHSHTDPRPHKSADGYHSHAHRHAAVFYDDHEIYLPSGRIAGHRNLNKFYRQNLHSYPSASERQEQAQKLLQQRRRPNDDVDGADDDADMADDDENTNGQSRNQSRVLLRRDQAGMLGATTAQKREVRAQEIRSRQQMQRSENRYLAKVQKQNNSQKHFRVSPHELLMSMVPRDEVLVNRSADVSCLQCLGSAPSVIISHGLVLLPPRTRVTRIVFMSTDRDYFVPSLPPFYSPHHHISS